MAVSLMDDPETGIEQHAAEFIVQLNGKKAKETVKNRRTHLIRFVRWVDANDVADVDFQTVEGFIHYQMEEGYSNDDINNSYYALKKFYEYLKKYEVVDESPTEKVNIGDYEQLKTGTKKFQHTHEDIHYVLADDVTSMAEHAHEAQGLPLRNELLIKLLFNTGCRAGELASIRTENVDQDRRRIRSKTFKNKKQKSRWVYCREGLDFLMNQWLDGGYRSGYPTAEASPYLFPSHKSEHINRKTVNRVVTQSAEAAGIQSTYVTTVDGKGRNVVTAHTLRHSFAIECLYSDIDIRTIQKVMGHEKLSTTEKYLQVIDKETQKRMKRFGTRRE